MRFIKDIKKITFKQWKSIITLSLLFYLITMVIYHGKQVGFHYMLTLVKSQGASGALLAIKEFIVTIPRMFFGIYGQRRKLVFLGLDIVGIAVVLGPKRFFSKLFEYRWIAGFVLWVFCIVNQYHGDSLGAYNYYIQPGVGSEYIVPVYGDIPLIRTDEWAVSTPARFSSSYGSEPYGLYNEVLRGGDTLNGISGIHVCPTSLVKNIFAFLYPVLGVGYAFAAEWWGQIILTFLVSIEFFLIVSGKKRLPALVGASLITMSSFYLWWGFPMVIWTSQAVIVCFYHYIKASSLRQRMLLAIGFIVSFGMFCTIFYPAWQVLFGYISIALALWIIHDNFDAVKRLRVIDYIIFLCSLLICMALLGCYFIENIEYIKAIGATVYPGHRLSNGGGYGIKLFSYIQAIFFGYKDVGVASEYGAFFGLFPIPFIGAMVSLFKSKKGDRANWYLVSLMAIYAILVGYVVVGLPMILCKLTLLTYTTATRAADVVGYIGVLLIVYLLSRDNESIKGKMGLVSAVIISPIAFVIGAKACSVMFPGYMNKGMLVVAFVFTVPAMIGILCNYSAVYKRLIMYGLIVVSVFTAISIRPLMKGYDAVFSKPVAQQIMAIVSADEDGLWVGAGENMIYQGYLAFLGARTENTTNKYPDMDFWHTIDPEGEYEDIYNRYCHVRIDFTTEDTWMELSAADCVDLHLSYADLDILEIEYIFTDKELDAGDLDELTVLYALDGAYIYQNDISDNK